MTEGTGRHDRGSSDDGPTARSSPAPASPGGTGWSVPAYGQQPPYGQLAWDQQPYPEQPYLQQAWGQHGAQPPPWGGPAWAPQRRTNTAAIWALVMSIVFPPVGLFLGLLARSQVRRTGEDGAGIARAAIIISIVYFAFVIGFVVFVGVLASTHPGQLPDSTTG